MKRREPFLLMQFQNIKESNDTTYLELAYNQISSIAYFRSQFQEGAHYIKKAIELKPNNIGGYLNLSTILTELGEHDESTYYLYKALNTLPDSPSLTQHIQSLHIYSALITEAVQSEELKLAEKYVGKADAVMSNLPGWPGKQSAVAEYLGIKVYYLSFTRDLEQAEKNVQRLDELNVSERLVPYSSLAQLYGLMKQPEKQMDMVEKLEKLVDDQYKGLNQGVYREYMLDAKSRSLPRFGKMG